MTSMILRMSAYLKVEVGMRVCYNCPTEGGDYRSNELFNRYRGREGTIVGFVTEFVPPLDKKGRLPGVYYTPGGISVQFDGEEEVHKGLNIDHFVLISPASTTELVALTHQRAGDLPKPVKFYPGDVVHKSDDLLKTERLIERVDISNEGDLVYTLAETQDGREVREAENEKCRKKALAAGRFPLTINRFPRTENVYEDEINLLRAGNTHHLYTDPNKMQFQSSAEEVLFWSQDGLSKTVYTGLSTDMNWKYSYERACEMLEAGKGDMIIKTRKYKNIVFTGRSGDHKVHRIHDCFGEHRDRIRKLSLALAEAPDELERTLADMSRSLMQM